MQGRADTLFLERVFHKLLLNFTWWVNRKDQDGRNIFQGGFLGLDNIGVFDRSAPLPTGGHIDQADGTAWMGMYCLNMLAIALELARTKPAYEDVATKFFEHFLAIARAIVNNPKVLLADEPTGNLDSACSREIMEMLAAFNREYGITIVLVTHDVDMAAFAKRTIRFLDGIIDTEEENGKML